LDEFIFLSFALLVVVSSVFVGRIYISCLYPWVALFSLVGVFSSFLNQVPIQVVLLGFMQAVQRFCTLILNQSITSGKRGANRVLKGLERFFSAVTVIAFLYMIIFDIALKFNPAPTNLDNPLERLGVFASRSFFPHPNTFAVVMVMCAIYHFTWVLLNRSHKTLFFLSVLCIVATIRMKPMFMLPVSLVILYFLIHIKKGRISHKALLVGFLLAITVCISVYALAVFTPLKDVLIMRFADNTTSVRILLFRSALSINLDTYGLGAGFGRFGSPVSAMNYYSPLYYKYRIAYLPHATPDDPSYITDQWWSWYLGEVGIIGTALFGGIILAAIFRLRHVALYWRGRDISMTALAYAAAGILVYGLSIGMVGNFLAGPPTSYYAMSLTGLAFALHRGLLRERGGR